MFAGDGRALFIAEFLPCLFIRGVRLKRAEANVSAPAFRQILGILLVIVDIALPSVRALTLIPDFGAGAGSAARKFTARKHAVRLQISESRSQVARITRNTQTLGERTALPHDFLRVLFNIVVEVAFDLRFA